MPNVTQVTDALIAKLAADVALVAAMPDGVWFNVAPQGKRRFVIVSLIVAFNEPELNGRRSFKDAYYLVEARALSADAGANAAVIAAAERIDVLLDPQPPLPPPTLAVSGYTLVNMECEEDVQETEQDDADLSIAWLRAGEQVRIQVAPI
jgi:uncharacterized membrane protein